MKLLLILAIVAAAAYASDESSFTEQSEPQAMLLNVKATITTMKKKGASASDCKNLAKTACKEVELEKRTNQKTLDALDSGSKCNNLGSQAQARSARAFKTTKARYVRSKRALSAAKKARVKIPSMRASSLSRGKCGAIFKSRSVLNARRKIVRAIQTTRVLRIKTASFRKAMQTAAKVARKMKKACQCNAQKAARKVWKVVSAKKLLKKQARAHQKCKMMSCALAGTNMKAKQCQGSLPALRKKQLTGATAGAKCGSSSKKKGPRRIIKKKGPCKDRQGATPACLTHKKRGSCKGIFIEKVCAKTCGFC